MMEAVLVLATLLRRFRFEMAGPNPVPFPSITLRPQGGPILRLVRRVVPDWRRSAVPSLPTAASNHASNLLLLCAAHCHQ